MIFQKRLLRIMQKKGWRVADLARALEVPYTTVREWALHGRVPAIDYRDTVDRALSKLER